MARDSRVNITINADGSQAIAGIQSVKGEMSRFSTESQTMAQRIRGSWLKVGGAIFGAALIIGRAWREADTAAVFQEQMRSITILGQQYGVTADQIVSDVQRATRGLINMQDAAKLGAKALLLGLNPQQMMEFFRMVETLTDATGDSIEAMYDRIIVAAATGRTMTLSQMGIIVSVKEAQEDYAASIGKTTAELTGQEKQTAILVATIDEMKKKTDLYAGAADTMKDKMDRLKVQTDDLRLAFGQFILKAGVGLFALLQSAAGVANMLTGAFYELASASGWLTDKLGITTGAAGIWGKKAEEAFKRADDAFGKSMESFTLAFSKTSEFYKFQGGKPPPQLGATGDAAETASKAVERLNERLRSLVDKQTLSQKELILKQADEWKKAGADRVLIEQWVQGELKKLAEKRKKELEEEDREFLEITEKAQREMLALHRERAEESSRIRLAELDAFRQAQGEVLSILGETGDLIGAEGFFQSLAGMMSAEGVDLYADELERLRSHWEQKRQLQSEGLASEKEAQAAHDRYMQFLQQKSTLNSLATYSGFVSGMQGLFQSLYTMTGGKLKALFYLERAVAVSRAIISAFEASAVALAKIPPPANVPFSKMVLALGLANAAAIGATAFMGGAPAGAGGGAAPGPAPTIEPFPVTEETKPEERPLVINIHVTGSMVDHDGFAREVLPSIRKAISDGA